MIKGQRANEAVDAVIGRIINARENSAGGLDRLMFTFPKMRTTPSGEWKEGTAVVVAAIAIARDPSVRVESVPEPVSYGQEHSIPSRLVLIDGIADVEYHVSRANVERMLEVGCMVIQPYKRGKRFTIRIPFELLDKLG